MTYICLHVRVLSHFRKLYPVFVLPAVNVLCTGLIVTDLCLAVPVRPTYVRLYSGVHIQLPVKYVLHAVP